MLSAELENIFDSAFCEVTRKLVKLDLQKTEEEEEDSLLTEGYREVIETHGYMNARIVCRFSDELFRYITDMMNCGETPSEEEIPLFINEYINITCGYAVSKLNNLVGHSSRLSVPNFYQGKESLGDKRMIQAGMYLVYRTKMGKLHIFMMYSFQSDQEEVV